MKWPFRIVIPGLPIAWKRPAQKSIGRRHWRFDSQKAEKETVKLHLIHACRKNGYQGHLFGSGEAYKVKMSFCLPTNQSDHPSEKNAKLWGLITPNEKPDCDNLTKFYLDCGNGILWSDDKRIVESYSKKIYSENPRTIIEIMPKQNLNLPSNITSVLRIFGPNELKELIKNVKELSNLCEDNINELLGESEEPNKQWRMARVALLLSRLAHSQVDNLKKILKFDNVEQEIKAMQPETSYE